MTDEQKASQAACPGHLSRDDAADLRWYFRRDGLGGFRISAMAVQLEQASRLVQHTIPCLACGGIPEVIEGGRVVAEAVRGTGYVWRKAVEARKAAERYAAMLAIRGPSGKRMAAHMCREDGNRVCPECLGMGRIPLVVRPPSGEGKAPDWRSGIVPAKPCPPTVRRCPPSPEHRQPTALPTGSSVHGKNPQDVGVPDADVRRLGRVSRELAELAAINPRAVEILELAESDDGNGRFALWPETPAGKTLLKRAPKDLDPYQALGAQLIAQSQTPDLNRGVLLSACARQAEALYAAACAAWNAVVNPPEAEDQAPDEDAPDEPPEDELSHSADLLERVTLLLERMQAGEVHHGSV